MLEKLRSSPKTLVSIGALLVVGMLAIPAYKYKWFHRAKKVQAKIEEEKSKTPSLFEKDPNRAPDALIVTSKLGDLPKDILAQKILKDLLTEDFVFYYQESEGYLSLKGSLKRIAFEHDMTIFDEILAKALQAPAEVAFWKSYNGRLEDYMMVLEKNLFASLMAAVGKVVSGDSQLSEVSEKKDSDGDVKIYKLAYANAKELYFGEMGSKFVLFSSLDMPLPTEEQVKRWSEASGLPTPSPGSSGLFPRLFSANDTKDKHQLYFSGKLISFGYQAYFPFAQAVRFNFSEKEGWSTQVKLPTDLAPDTLKTQEIWKIAPNNASLCVSLSADKTRLSDVFQKLFEGKEEQAKGLANTIRSPVAICWYKDSKAYTPLVLAKVAESAQDSLLKEAFEKSVGNLEAGILTAEEKEELQEQLKQKAEGEEVELLRPKNYEPANAVVEEKSGGGTLWTREVSSRYGSYDAKKSKNGSKMRSKKFFKVSMVRWKDNVAFSADDALVANALSTMNKKFPALSDSLGTQGENTAIYLSPARLGELLKKSTLESLPAQQESVFRESVSRRLFPAFDRMGKLPAMTLLSRTSGKTDAWEEWKWQNVSSN